MAERPTQPRCAECNHARSFHPDGKRCVAFGCKCKRWRLTAKKAAAKVGKAVKKAKAPASA